MNERLSLTLSLSPWERGRPPDEQASPLPWGEGRVRGERRSLRLTANFSTYAPALGRRCGVTTAGA